MLKEIHIVDLLVRLGLATALLTIAAAGCTIVALDALGWFPDLEKPRGWVATATIVAAWGFALLHARDFGARFLSWRRARIKARRDEQTAQAEEAELLERINLLEPRERCILAYCKHKGLRQFRANRHASGMWALENMKLIRQHESLNRDASRFSISQAVFGLINVVPDEAKILDKFKSAPWELP